MRRHLRKSLSSTRVEQKTVKVDEKAGVKSSWSWIVLLQDIGTRREEIGFEVKLYFITLRRDNRREGTTL